MHFFLHYKIISRKLQNAITHVLPMSVTVSLLWVCDSSPSSFSDSESCRDSLVLLRLPARRMEDSEPPFLTRKLRAPLIWSSREPPIRILRMGAGEDGSGETSSALFIKISTQGNDKPIGFFCMTPDLTLSFLRLLVIAGGVRLQRMAAAVERIVPVLVIEDARKADLPLIAMTAELRVQTQTAAVQILKATREQVFILKDLRIFHVVLQYCKRFLTQWMHIFWCDWPRGVQCVGEVSMERSLAGKWWFPTTAGRRPSLERRGSHIS